MADLEKLTQNLERLGYAVSRFATAREAADYLDREIDGLSVGIGGSVTVRDMELYPRLAAHNQMAWHWADGTLEQAMATDAYISSVNAIAETGEIINIDGVGNRVASTLFGHKRVYFVTGINKVAPDYDAALWRARNVAAPKNARRLNKKTPCAVNADRCYNCESPDRICKALTVLWGKPTHLERMEVVLVEEELGF